jgi:hypothetical protein
MTVQVRGDAAAGTEWFDSPHAELVPRDISPPHLPAGTDWDVDVYPKGEDGLRLPGRERKFILSHYGVTAADPAAAADAAARLADLL